MNHLWTRQRLERLYNTYNRRCFVHPDPLEFLYRYENPQDREVVALVAALLAYGRVDQILKSVSGVLKGLGTSPAEYLRNTTHARLDKVFNGFVYRFTKGCDIAGLLAGIGRILREHGSMKNAFLNGLKNSDETVLPALILFYDEIIKNMHSCHLLPDPRRGSACKRYCLFLRWMVRSDDVDPGGWEEVSARRLIVPMDVHMHRIATEFQLTGARSANMKTAREVTGAFRQICPEDPVRYDFVLTRFGIRKALDSRFDCLAETLENQL